MCIPLQSGVAKNECRAHAREISVSMCSSFFVIRRSRRKLSAISAIYPLHRTKALRNSLSLSATPNESPPNHGMPIRRSRRKPSAIPSAYPLHQMKALSNSCGLSAAPNESSPNHRRPISRTRRKSAAIPLAYWRCWLLLIIDAFYAGRDGGEYLVGDRSEAFGHLRYG